MKPVIAGAAAAKPDAFLAFTYPGDTFGITAKAVELKFEPKVFFAAVGVAYPTFKQQFGTGIDGVLGMGGRDASLPALQAYFKRHVAVTGREPDRWVSPITYATLQILQQAMSEWARSIGPPSSNKSRRGVLKPRWDFCDTTAICSTGIGMLVRQDGEFYGIAPASMPGARAIPSPTSAWHSIE